MKKGVGTLNTKKITLAIGVLIVFIGYLYFSQGRDEHFKVDSQAFPVIDSFEGLMANQASNMKGLSQAEKDRSIKHLDQTIKLPDKRDLQLHRVWLTPDANGGIYLLYSVNVLKGDKQPKDVPTLTAKRMTFTFKSGSSPVHFAVGKKDVFENVYQKRLYRGVILYPENKPRGTFADPLKSVTLENVELQSNEEKLNVKNLRFDSNR